MNADEYAPTTPAPESERLFVEAVQGCDALPESVRERASFAIIRDSLFDHTYLEFLDQQIQLSPRGPEWSDRLRQRRTALAPYCDVPLVDGHIETPSGSYTIYVSPKLNCVIHWESYENARNA